MGCGALLVACAVCGIAIAAISSANGGGSTAAHTSATATAAPRATATADKNAGYQAYTAVVVADLAPVSKDATNIGTDCGASNVSACRADAVQFQTDITAMQHDLDAHPAPPCLATVDAHIRSALDLYSQSATDLINGIDQTDASLITKAGTEMQTGTTEMTAANTSMGTAHC